RRIFGECAVAQAENIIAGAQTLDAVANSFDASSDIHAAYPDLRLADSHRHAREVRRTAHVVPVKWVHAGGVHPNEHSAVLDVRFFDLLQAQHLRRAVLVLENGLHNIESPFPVTRRATPRSGWLRWMGSLLRFANYSAAEDECETVFQ